MSFLKGLNAMCAPGAVANHLPSGSQEVHPHVSQSNADGKGLMIKASQALKLKQNLYTGLLTVKPTTSIPANALANGGQVDYRIGAPGFNHQMDVRLKVNNSGAAAITFLPQKLFRVEVMRNSSNEILQTIGSEEIWLESLMENKEEYDRTRLLVNQDASYEPSAPLAAGATAVYHVRVRTLLDNTHLFTNSLNSKILVRIHFHGSSAVESGTAADLVLQECDIILHTTHHDPADEREMQSRFKREPHHYRWLNANKQTFTMNLSPSTQYQLQLNSIKGASAYDVFMIRPMPYSGANLRNPVAIDSFELRDRDNILAGISMDDKYNRYEISKAFPSDMTTVKPIYVIPHGSPELAHQGQVTGQYIYSSQESLVFTTDSSLVAGSYRIDFISYQYALLEVDASGNMSVQK